MRALAAVLIWSVGVLAIGAEKEADQEAPIDVEAILNQAPSSEDYSKEVRCITTARIREVDVLDGRHLVFRVGSNERYLVQLAFRCPALRKKSTVMYETNNGMSLCKMDTIRGFFDQSSTRPGPPCSIPGFQAITKEQHALLKESL